MGIIKVDLLGLGMMAVLEDSLNLIRDQYGETVDLAHIPKDDAQVYSALQKADTVGLFQVESRAQMSCLPRLRPARFYDIVVQIALIRPGPIVGDMVHPYLRRREGKEPPACIHSLLEPVLKRTLGVPLFQEQLLRMAMLCAGFSGGEAEELRRAFGFKRPDAKMRDVEVKLRAGMERNGIAGEVQDEVVRAITSFAAYGFPESHAASFALIAYASAYLKIHYPAAFTAAILNNQPMGFYHPATLIKDAQRHGLRIKPIDVTRSDWLCTVESDSREGTISEAAASGSDSGAGQPVYCVRLGLNYVKGLRAAAGQALVAERTRKPLSSIDDIRQRVPCLNRKEMQRLAQVGALNFIPAPGAPAKRLNKSQTAHRRSASWEVTRVLRPTGPLLNAAASQRDYRDQVRIEPCPSIDGIEYLNSTSDSEWPGSGNVEKKEVTCPLKQMTPGERLEADLKGTSLTIGPHAMVYLRKEMQSLGVTSVCDMARVRDGAPVRIGGLVIVRQRPGSAKGFMFLSVEDETGILNVIVSPTVFDNHKVVLLENNLLIVDGIAQVQGGVASVKATRIHPLQVALHATPSHDFH
jgi:error-prone DNA polymerase